MIIGVAGCTIQGDKKVGGVGRITNIMYGEPSDVRSV